MFWSKPTGLLIAVDISPASCCCSEISSIKSWTLSTSLKHKQNQLKLAEHNQADKTYFSVTYKSPLAFLNALEALPIALSTSAFVLAFSKTSR